MTRFKRIALLLLALALLFVSSCAGGKTASPDGASAGETSDELLASASQGADGSAGQSGNGGSTSSKQATGNSKNNQGTGSNAPGVSTGAPPGVASTLSGDFSIVKNGQPMATIVLAKNPTEKARLAAEDLQSYIQKMTGATLKIGFDSSDRTNGNYILVGKTSYTTKMGVSQPTGYPDKERVILKRDKNYLMLLGNDDGPYMGTQFAVTMFLERLGCGWFGPEDLWQVVPATKEISVGSLNVSHTPKFTTRQNNLSNYPEVADRWYIGGNAGTYGHYLPHLVGKDVYFKTHPEWFSLIGGKRDVSAEWWQYCYSNKEFAAEVAKKVIERFNTDPNLVSFPLTANDGWETDWCECTECAKHPNDSDLTLYFANNVARLVAQKYPQKKLHILSYHSTWFAPQSSIKAEPNVEIMFCTETSMTNPIENGLHLGSTRNPITHNTYNTSWKENFAKYVSRANVKNISIWRWNCLAVDKPAWQYVPWVQGDVAIRDQNFWKKNGAAYVYYDQGPLGVYRETSASFPLRWPLWYVSSKGMWDASLSGDQLLYEACIKLFGKGADVMLAYYKALAAASESCTASSICWVPPSPGEVYTAYHVARIDKTISDARAKLSSVSANEKKRMENQINLWESAKAQF